MNESVGLLDTRPLPALTTQNQSVLTAEQSVDGHDRRGWAQATIALVLHQTEHHPRMSRDISLHTTTARQRGEFPDAESAILLEQTGVSHVGEWALNAGGFVIGLVGEPFALLLQGRSPWSVTRDSPAPFEAVPSDSETVYDARWVTAPMTGSDAWHNAEEAQP